MRRFTKTVPNALVHPYKMRGETITYASITVLANTVSEAEAKFIKYYDLGVGLGVYKERK